MRIKAFWIIVFSGFIFLLNYYVAVKTRYGQVFEEKMLGESEFNNDPMAPLAFVQPVLIVLFLAVMSIYIWAKMSIKKALIFWFMSGFALVFGQLLKLTLKRENLLDPEALGTLTENTLPSGHMSVFVTVLGMILLLVPENRWKNTYWFVLLLLSVVAWQLLDYGWHRVSDLIAAIAATVFIFSLVKFIFPDIVGYAKSLRDPSGNKNNSVRYEKLWNVLFNSLNWLTFIGFVFLLGVIFYQNYTGDKIFLTIGFILTVLTQAVALRMLKSLR